jgi:hypothetical protein
VDVFEGSVQLTPYAASKAVRTLEQGDEAVTTGDSIEETEIMNRLTAHKRGSLLRDYLQSTVFGDNYGVMRDSLTSSEPGR